MHFVIANGKLDLTEEYKNSAQFRSWSELNWNKASETLFGIENTEPELPADNELTVFVADAQPPMLKVTKGDVVRVSTDDALDYLFVTWARNVDRSEDVLVAVTSERSIKAANDKFVELSLDAWQEMPGWQELVRLFRNPIEAEAATRNGTTVIPWSGADGWQGVLIHSAKINDKSGHLDAEFLRELDVKAMIGIPDGIPIEHSAADLILTDILGDSEENVFGSMAEVQVSQIIVTRDGGIYVLLEMQNSVLGRKLVGRHFSHDEAKERLHL